MSTPRRRLPAAARRELVLDAAVEVFARDGYAGCSTAALAAAAGVTKPVLYDHFPTKAALYRGALEREAQRLLTAVAPHLDPRRPLDDRLRAIALTLVAHVRAHPAAARMLLVAPEGDAEVREAHAAGQQLAVATTTEAILADPVFAGSPGLSRRAAATLVAELHTAAFARLALYALEHPRASARALAEVLMWVTWDGLGSDRSGRGSADRPAQR